MFTILSNGISSSSPRHSILMTGSASDAASDAVSHHPPRKIFENINEPVAISTEPAVMSRKPMSAVMATSTPIPTLVAVIPRSSTTTDAFHHRLTARHLAASLTSSLFFRYSSAILANLSIASLSLLTPNPDWRLDRRGRESLSARFRICDFACGTGVLLSAAYRALLALYTEFRTAEGRDASLMGLHWDVVEIWGFDASEEALSQALRYLEPLTLGSLACELNIHHVPVNEKGSLGSLSLWRNDGFQRGDIPLFNLVIMNPPYSRTTAPGAAGSRPRIFDYAKSSEDFQRLWKSYRELIREMERELKRDERIARLISEHIGRGRTFLAKNVDPLKAGAALPFVILADRYLKPGGRLALVLPRSALESSSFFLLRALLASRYLVEFIVVSSEDGNPSFSERTQMSEILLVARKVSGWSYEPDQALNVVVIRKQPRRVLEGALLAREVLRVKPTLESVQLVRAGSAEAEVRAASQSSVEELVWNMSLIVGLPPRIRSMIERVAKGDLPGVSVGMSRVTDIPGLSMTNPRVFRAKRFSSHFSYSPSGSLRILDASGRSVMDRLLLDPSKARPISPKGRRAVEVYEKRSGRLLVPEAIRFDTASLIAVWSPEPLASSRAHMLRAEPAIERALCVWLNSSPAVAWLRATFTTLESRFGHFYGWHIRNLPVPDLGDPALLRELDLIFEEYSGVSWPPLPEQFKRAVEGNYSPRLNYDLDVFGAIARAQGTDLSCREAESALLEFYSDMLELL